MFPDATLLPVAEGMPPTNSALRLRVGRRMSTAVAVAETICRGADAPQVLTPVPRRADEPRPQAYSGRSLNGRPRVSGNVTKSGSAFHAFHAESVDP